MELRLNTVYNTNRFVVCFIETAKFTEISIYNKESEEWELVAEESYPNKTRLESIKQLRKDLNLYNM